PNGLDQARLTEVSEVAGPRIRRPVIMVPEVTTGDHAKGADGGQRAGFRPAQQVVAIRAANELTFESTRQMEMPRERVTGVSIAVAAIAVAGVPPRVRGAVATAVFRALPLVPWPPTERPRIVVIPVVPVQSRRAPVLVTIAFIGAIAASAAGSAGVPM